MGKIIDTLINRWDGGIADDVLEAPMNTSALSKHFDILSKKHRLIPYRDMEAEGGSISAYKIGSVELFTDSGGTQNLYALGSISGDTFPQFLEKSGGIIAGTFALSTTGADTTGVVIAHTLKGYRTKLFGLKTLSGNTVIKSYDPVTDTLATTGTITGTSSTGVYPRPFRHPQDDILYFGAGNVIATLNNVTFTAAALTLPSNLTITSLTDYGIYLAIACAPKDAGEKSYLFLWGRDTSLTTVQEVVEFGEGALMIVENVGGALVGISSVAQGAGSAIDINPKITFRTYTGGTPRIFKEIQWTGTGTPTSLLLKNFKAKKNDNLYFALSTYIQGQTVNQIWMVGKNALGQLAVTADRLPNNDTALSANVDGLSSVGDYLFVAFNGAGALNRTNDSASFTATSVYESVYYNAGDSSIKKKLTGITLMTEYLPSGASVVVKYKKDAETSFTTIFTNTTLNSISHSAVNIESSGAQLPEYKEISFRIESTGGAVVTALKFRSETLDKDVY